MASTIGNILKITLFGQSHGECVGAVIDGLPHGIKIGFDFIKKEIGKRKLESYSTDRQEDDAVKFLSGLFEDKTTGDPLAFIIKNNDQHSCDYTKGVIRPSHADLTAYLKSEGKNDYRGGGFTSGRVATPLIVVGAICKQILNKLNVQIYSHISSINGIYDDEFNYENIPSSLNDSPFPVLSIKAEKEMKEQILKAKDNQDSVGGTLETVVMNCPIGLGEPYFDSLESYISHLLFSIGGIKGVLFGDGLDFSKKLGSQVADELSFVNDKVTFKSNHNGGINGGISNGQPIVIKTIVKPTPSIGKELNSINIETKENIKLFTKGRHDPCIVHRVRMIQESLIAFAILDMWMINKSKEL